MLRGSLGGLTVSLHFFEIKFIKVLEQRVNLFGGVGAVASRDPFVVHSKELARK